LRLHGEANEVSEQEAEENMDLFRKELHYLMSTWNVDPERVFNADQTGLFYQKLPNRVYCKKYMAGSVRGSKIMREKARLSLMVCVSATGLKAPLALVGTAKRPNCFSLCGNAPPMAYTNQTNSWFDRNITIWWLQNVFAPFCFRRWGDKKVILILDNCPCHMNIPLESIPKNVVPVFLPENLTSRHQPCNLGIIAQLKLGYRTVYLEKLLMICDSVDLYEQAVALRNRTRDGCKGISRIQDRKHTSQPSNDGLPTRVAARWEPNGILHNGFWLLQNALSRRMEMTAEYSHFSCVII
jgi:hypothetical protein